MFSTILKLPHNWPTFGIIEYSLIFLFFLSFSYITASKSITPCSFGDTKDKELISVSS